jgi:CRP-like cAMP-binding protein
VSEPGREGGQAPAGFLGQLRPDEMEALSTGGRKQRFRAGSTLFHEGETSDRLLGVLSGRVKISSFTGDGREILLAVRGPGDLLGELSSIDGEPRSATASALDDVEALVVGASAFKAFLEAHPRVALLMLEMVTRRLRDADRKRIEFTAHDTVGRVARRLVELAERFGESDGAALRIALPLSQQELAGWTGSSREAANKALQSLRARGWIETQRRGIRVLDLEALRRRAT